MARSEVDMDAALARLAREAAEASPRPGHDLVLRVLADAALTALARDAAEASPRAGPALVARVLADAASAGAQRSAGRPAASRSRAGAVPGVRLLDMLFGWRAGALAAMAVALAVGLGVGMEIEALPILDQPAGSESISLASIDADFMGMSGL